ncbi:MAG: superoxide dismutase [Flavobacteriaceae bacterium]|jgi:superoxide dismutase, Fe-Mn family|nr:superoxide dismutase [Flavobacteriaceae bacterium]
MSFLLPELGFGYADLEPHIDARTMEIHYSKHHNGYTNNLNNALDKANISDQTIEEILTNLDMNNMAVRNNAGGYYNHCLFWEILNPNNKQDLGGDLESAINSSFDSFDSFKEQFSKAAATRFGSGWAWLCAKDGKLEICSSANQDNPIMPSIGCGGQPIMGIDVWEHAYYLNYQNRRVDYVSAFFDVVNWRVVAEKFKNS